jgi:hypothetical protein
MRHDRRVSDSCRSSKHKRTIARTALGSRTRNSPPKSYSIPGSQHETTNWLSRVYVGLLEVKRTTLALLETSDSDPGCVKTSCLLSTVNEGHGQKMRCYWPVLRAFARLKQGISGRGVDRSQTAEAAQSSKAARPASQRRHGRLPWFAQSVTLVLPLDAKLQRLGVRSRRARPANFSASR